MNPSEHPAVKKSLKNIQKKGGKWPQENDVFFYIYGSDFRVGSDTWRGLLFDRRVMENRNIFKTKEEAEKVAKRIREFIKKANPRTKEES